MAMKAALRLAVAAEDWPRLRLALLAMAGDAGSASTGMTTTYFRQLDRRPRLNRRNPRRAAQTYRHLQEVTTKAVAGVAAGRGERQDEPGGTAPLPGGTNTARIPKNREPLFTASVERLVVELTPRAGTRVVVALDQGEIRLCRSEPHHVRDIISEIALELQAGDAAVLYDLALRLNEIVPLRLDLRSTAERGWRLTEGTAAKPPIFHGTAPRLDKSMSAEAALRAIGLAGLACVLRNEEAALAERPGGVHQMRIAIRRLRAILSAAKPMLPAEHFLWANRELKWLANELAPARNWDVIARQLLAPLGDALGDEPDFPGLCAAVEVRRREAYASARATILSPRYTDTLLRLSRWFAARGWRDQPVSRKSARLVTPIGKIGTRMIARCHRAAWRRSRHFNCLSPPQRHKLRIALKKLRYTVEFLQPLYAKSVSRRFLRGIAALQNDLGRDNDLRQAQHMLAGPDLDGSSAALQHIAGVVLGWHSRGLVERQASTARHLRRMHRAKPFW